MRQISRKTFASFAALAALAVLISACGGSPVATETPSATQAQATEAPAATATPASQTTEFVTWYQYDEKNEDPKNDEAVGNAYLRDSMAKFNAEFKDKFVWVNQPQQWQKMDTSLVTAVQAGGEVPDLMHTGAGSLPLYLKNGSVQDITDWIKAQSWFADLDPNAVKACTGPDGKIYCMPLAEQPNVVFYWKDYFPNGFPKTADEFLKRAEELKKENVYAITYFGSTAFEGDATGRYFNSVIASFGGSYDDGKGNLQLNKPANIKAIEFMREVVQKGFSSDNVFLGDFKEENDLKGVDANAPRAASFPTGSFGYRYIQPVKAPNGKQYGDAFDPTGGPMLQAITAGDMAISSLFTGGDATQPGCHVGISSFVIPAGAKNPDGAKAYINWLMDPANGVEWVQKPGGGLPVNQKLMQEKAFDTPFYKQVAAASAGLCKPWSGSLVRLPEAKKIIAATIFDLIKTNPTADIAAALQKADDEYNRGN